MAFGKTSTLLIALFAGFAALIVSIVSLATPYWTQASYSGRVRDYFMPNDTLIQAPMPRLLVRNRGLWTYCHYVLNGDYPVAEDDLDLTVTGTTQMPRNNTGEPPDALVECEVYNITASIPASSPGAGFLSMRFYMEKCSAVVACAALCMQFCAAMTSIQGTWTMLTVLFTDCGIMFLIGALFSLLSCLFFMISYIYGNHEVPEAFPAFPPGYQLDYSWSFYLAWSAFGLSLFSGTLYLLIARAWHLEEVWVRAQVEKPGMVKKDDTMSSRRKLMGKL